MAPAGPSADSISMQMNNPPLPLPPAGRSTLTKRASPKNPFQSRELIFRCCVFFFSLPPFSKLSEHVGGRSNKAAAAGIEFLSLHFWREGLSAGSLASGRRDPLAKLASLLTAVGPLLKRPRPAAGCWFESCWFFVVFLKREYPVLGIKNSKEKGKKKTPSPPAAQSRFLFFSSA